MSSGFTTGCTVAISGWRQKASMARRLTVLPPMVRYCLGPPAPARSPRPAATRMAAVRSGLDMRLQGLSKRLGVVGSLAAWAQAAKPLPRRLAKTEQLPIAVGKANLAAVHLHISE